MLLRNLSYLFFVTLPILAGYLFIPGLGLGEFLLLIIMLFFSLNKTIYIPQHLIILWAFIVLHGLLVILMNPSYLTHPDLIWKYLLRFTMFILITVIASSIFNQEYLLRYLKGASFFFGIVLIVQFITYYLNGSVIWDGVLPYLTPEHQSRAVGIRITSMFSEPSAVSVYMFPILYLMLIKSEMKWSIYLTVVMIISTSSLGFFVSILLWLLFFAKNNSSFRKVIIGVASILLSAAIISQNEWGYSSLTFAIDKIKIINLMENPRLFRGFYYFWEMPQVNKIFGAGYNQVYDLLMDQNVYIKYGYYDGVFMKYMNSIAAILNSYGILGCAIFIYFLKQIFNNLERQYLPLFFVMVIIMFVSDYYFNAFSIITLVILLINSSKKRNIKFQFNIAPG
jgi:hypothetical protein